MSNKIACAYVSFSRLDIIFIPLKLTPFNRGVFLLPLIMDYSEYINEIYFDADVFLISNDYGGAYVVNESYEYDMTNVHVVLHQALPKLDKSCHLNIIKEIRQI